MQRGEGTQREASGYRRQGGDAARLPPKLVHQHRNKYGGVMSGFKYIANW